MAEQAGYVEQLESELAVLREKNVQQDRGAHALQVHTSSMADFLLSKLGRGDYLPFEEFDPQVQVQIDAVEATASYQLVHALQKRDLTVLQRSIVDQYVRK